MKSCPCQPSIVIASGGGWHCYWLLKEPLDLSTERNEAYRHLQGLAAAVGGDPASAEPARILRLLGTVNHKYDPPRKVAVEACDPDRRYTPEEFDWLPVTVEEPGATRAELDLSTPVPVGSRNATLYRVGRSQRAHKVPDAAIASTLRAMNHDSTVVETPLPKQEVETIIRNVTGQPNRPEVDEEKQVGRSPIITMLHTVTAEEISWLWPGRIARGKY